MKISLKDILIFSILYVFAIVSWYIVYVEQVFNFWLGAASTVWILGTLSMHYYGTPITQKDINLRAFTIGIVSAGVLYLAFSLGSQVLPILYSGAQADLDAIANLKNNSSLLIMSSVLFFVTSPFEEIFWRGYIQKLFAQKFNRDIGIITSVLLYTAVQIPTGNIVLILAALIAGLYWSILYAITNNLFITIVSHAFWAVISYIVFPVL